MDAYEDLEEDIKKGCYNPLKKLYTQEDYEERLKQILCMMIAECSLEFEKLPCIVDVYILRNISVSYTHLHTQCLKAAGPEECSPRKPVHGCVW